MACKKLKDLDLITKSDPICILQEKQVNGTWKEVGRTEKKNDTLNPIFDKNFQLNYYFERHQHLQFKLIDDDGNDKFDLIGIFETTLGKIMGARQQTTIADLIKDGKHARGQIIIQADSIKDSNWEVQMKMGC